MMSEEFDLDFGPKFYWGQQNLTFYLGSHITGELRKQAAKNEAPSGSDLSVAYKPSFDSTMPSLQGSIHPWLMGGEYLPFSALMNWRWHGSLLAVSKRSKTRLRYASGSHSELVGGRGPVQAPVGVGGNECHSKKTASSALRRQ